MDLKLKEIILTKEEIQDRVKELADEVSKDIETDRPLFVSILNGSFIFCSDLVQNIKFPVEIQFIKASSYYDQTESSGEVTVYDYGLEVKDRDVILVEDIVDTGRTLKKLTEVFNRLGAKSVKSMVLLDKPARRVVEFKPDYTGFEIEDNFVVGYGNDYKQFGRNLPYIGIIDET